MKFLGSNPETLRSGRTHLQQTKSYKQAWKFLIAILIPRKGPVDFPFPKPPMPLYCVSSASWGFFAVFPSQLSQSALLKSFTLKEVTPKP